MSGVKICAGLRANVLTFLVVILVAAAPAGAQELYFDLPLMEVPLVEGAFPPADQPVTAETVGSWESMRYLPRADMGQAGEAFLVREDDLAAFRRGGNLEPSAYRLVARVEKGQAWEGHIVWPSDGGSKANLVRFKLSADKATAKGYARFWASRAAHYEELANRQLPGQSWFRFQANRSRAFAQLKPGQKPAPRPMGMSSDLCTPEQVQSDQLSPKLAESMDLLTGAMAISENMQFGQVACHGASASRWVPLDQVPAITVPPVDWSAHMPFSAARLDRLSAWIPHDNYGLLFPSFSAMVQLFDELDTYGTPFLPGFDGVSHDAETHQRYEKQLCLEVSQAARMLGPKVVASVAITGADPFLVSGSDLTLLFEAREPGVLHQYLQGKHHSAALANEGAEQLSGELWGVAWSGVVTGDRSVSSYVARVGDVVLVSNSLVALERAISASAGRIPSLLFTEEYLFFRERYQREEEESALLLVTDEAIRKWGGPAWRIADSRRMRVASLLTGAAVQFANARATGEWPATSLPEPARKGRKAPKKAPTCEPSQESYFPLLSSVPDAELFWVTPGEIGNSVYGTRRFLTPIVELVPAAATVEEVAAYGAFRTRYENIWRGVFDPLAVRFAVGPNGISVDLSLFPIVLNSEYREMIELTGNNQLPDSLHFPEESMAVVGFSLNPESKLVRELNSFSSMMVPGLGRAGFGWLGRWFRAYAGDDPFWAELAEIGDPDDMAAFAEKQFYRLPVVAEVAVANPMAMAGFLTALRGFAESTAPGMVVWETQEHNEHPYVRVKTLGVGGDEALSKLAIYYSTVESVFILSLNENLFKKAIDRHKGVARTPVTTGQEDMHGLQFLGASFGTAFHFRFLELVSALASDETSKWEQQVAFKALPILNEWRRLFPERDVLEVHSEVFAAKLTAPASGQYEWGPALWSYASTVHGQPGAPKKGPGPLRPPFEAISTANFGISFELGGLRARFSITRQPATSKVETPR